MKWIKPENETPPYNKIILMIGVEIMIWKATKKTVEERIEKIEQNERDIIRMIIDLHKNIKNIEKDFSLIKEARGILEIPK